MKAYEIMNHLEKYFPLNLQMDFDCCGLQIGSREKEVKKVYIALNADNETLQACIENNCQMLITHHPFLLEKIKNLDTSLHQGKFISTAMKHDIVVYSLHTCLDRGQNGISMNDWLIQKLGVHDVACYDHYEVGKKAILNEAINGKDFIEKVKDIFHIEHLKYSKNTNKMIHTIAICGGSAADDLEILADQVDCYITGDTKYRHAKYAIDHDCLLIDSGHHLEVIIEEKLPELYPVGLLHGTYIVCENEDGFYLIDQHAAKERINYEKYKYILGHPNNNTISPLIPIIIELPLDEFAIIKENIDIFDKLNITLDEFGTQSYRVISHPTWFIQGKEEELIRKIIELVIQKEKNFSLEKFNDNLAKMISCKMSIKGNTYIDTPSMESLINDLRKCDNPFNCPHGRPTIIHFTKYELEKMFKRSM